MTRERAVSYLRAVIAQCEASAATHDLSVLTIQAAIAEASEDDVAMYLLEIQHKRGHAAVSRDTARKCRALLTEWGETP